jgi:hypothetical protein
MPTTETQPSRSPLRLAIGISFAIAAGTVLSTLDAAIFDDIAGGKWLTRSFTETQERQTASIAALERNVGAVTTDLDFVASRVSAAVRRNENEARERFAEIEARLAALRDRAMGTPAADASNDVMGLRSSVHELAAAHNGAVSAITRRLNRVEAMVGISTDVAPMAAHSAARRNAAARKPAPQPAELQSGERGHIFGVKPQNLRLSRLPG